MVELPLIKVFIVYDTKYGNTKLVAEKIAEGMNEVEGIDTAIIDVNEVDLEKVADSDAILMGTPNHMGGPARTIMNFIDKLGRLELKAKWFAVFDTYMERDVEKAAKKMEKRMSEKVPQLKQMAPGLSIKVQGMKGPPVESEIPRCIEFGKKIATQLKTEKND